jgi:hypothetical protein
LFDSMNRVSTFPFPRHAKKPEGKPDIIGFGIR